MKNGEEKESKEIKGVGKHVGERRIKKRNKICVRKSVGLICWHTRERLGAQPKVDCPCGLRSRGLRGG